MNSDTPKPKMEGDRAKEVTKQTTTRTDNTTRQPSAIKTTNPVQHLVDITDALKIAKSKPTSTLSPADAAEWEEVFKPELSEEDNGSDDWEMIDECDAKPCVVPAKKLLAKRQKKVGSLAKLDLELAAAKSTTKDMVKVIETKRRRKELNGAIERIDRLLDEVNAESSRS